MQLAMRRQIDRVWCRTTISGISCCLSLEEIDLLRWFYISLSIDSHFQIINESEPATIEGPVMQSTESDPISEIIGSVFVLRIDMC
jgi:hypothetical protein